jgi:tRNA/tmRNA/rRNA uracil-C5-methylase (TrmA/RlmC/RlmD family)
MALRQVWQEVAGTIAGAEDVVAGDALQIVPSPAPYAYRTRMDYVATKDRFGLRRSGRWNYIVELETCHLIPPHGFAAAHALWVRSRELGLPDYNLRTHEGFLRYLVVRRSPQDTFLIAAIAAGGAGRYDAEMESLAALALEQPGVVGFHWLCNDTLTDISYGSAVRHWGEHLLPMQVGDRTICIGPNTFFQNNVLLLLPMLDAIREAVNKTLPPGPPLRVADLYGGVGTIALHLDRERIESVAIVESHGESADLARHNLALNGVDRGAGKGGIEMEVFAADVGDYVQAQVPGAFDCLVLDPPRTGLGEPVCRELLRLRPQRIVYLSCNPLTQASDVGILSQGYRLTSLRGYDMFPHTPHIETLAVLDMR